jgi:hypothetical protein
VGSWRSGWPPLAAASARSLLQRSRRLHGGRWGSSRNLLAAVAGGRTARAVMPLRGRLQRWAGHPGRRALFLGHVESMGTLPVGRDGGSSGEARKGAARERERERGVASVSEWG